ncbi:uncharacterized protein BXZ73DRAFT_11369, partial [Epithele typhae]|uniref:uncharacterized protein n=1 Tax=Epithele typhae TaxID=378194 RepID=UPI002007BB86
CPYCPWVRTDDCAALWFRHVKSHLGEVIPPQWVCAGVPLERAGEFGLRPGEGDAYWFDGRKMVGGCLMGFSRRDSLRRHLYVTKGSGCVGDLKAPWIEGNK